MIADEKLFVDFKIVVKNNITVPRSLHRFKVSSLSKYKNFEYCFIVLFIAKKSIVYRNEL